MKIFCQKTWNYSKHNIAGLAGRKKKVCSVRNLRRQHRNCSLFALSLYQTVNTEQEGWEEKYHHVSACLPSALPLNSIESQYIFISVRPWDLLILLQPTCRPRRGLFFWQTAKVDFVRNLLRLLAEFPAIKYYQMVEVRQEITDLELPRH